MHRAQLRALILSLAIILSSPLFAGPGLQSQSSSVASDRALLDAVQSIDGRILYEYVRELVSEKYGGRLAGTPEYNLCADWVASLLNKWGLEPAGDNGTYFQAFPDPYTLILRDCALSLHVPVGSGPTKGEITKSYHFDDEYIAGGTSGSGEVTAEVIYVGYGISAPELGYDDYAGVDVKGKIVLMEREVPVDPEANPEVFKKWRPYSFHQYKLETAAAKGAKGMIYNYGPIGNPNNSYREGFVYSHVGEAVVTDVFAGTGRNHADIVNRINKLLRPCSFATGKVMTLKNRTEYHPEGIGRSVLGLIRGADPALKDEIIIMGGHLDHLGRYGDQEMPGANDNAVSVAALLGQAEAMARYPVKPRRSVLFCFFGAEEQGVKGSQFYTEHPLFPLAKTVAMINLEGVGEGNKLHLLAGKNFPGLFQFFEKANQKFLHRVLTSSSFSNIARPRQDVTWFLWKGVPGVTLRAVGAGFAVPYHNTHDNLSLVQSPILEDASRLLFLTVEDLAGTDSVDFRTKGN
jgi:hypothetical protein